MSDPTPMKRRGFLAGGIATLTAALAACSKPAANTATTEAAASSAPPAPPPPVVSASASASASSSSASSSVIDWEAVDTVANVPAKVRVSMMTTKGEIVVELNGKAAPITVNNFLRYVDSGKLNGANFWRAANSGPTGFIQATAKGPTFPPIAHEPTSKTGLTHTDGAISMSRFDPGTATADFVICIGDNTFLDAGRDGSTDKLGYAAFGHVVKGMNVVHAILEGRISTKAAKAGQWAGQMLARPVIITSAKRVG